MEGSRRGQKPSLEVERRFANSRLERQILVRVYELVVPVVRRNLGHELPSAVDAERLDTEVSAQLTKGA